MNMVYWKSLEILPIWVATGQAAQSIPLVAGEFDLILIDEASQCTLTNLYRYCSEEKESASLVIRIN